MNALIARRISRSLTINDNFKIEINLFYFIYLIGFPVLLRNRLISAGLEPVLSYTKRIMHSFVLRKIIKLISVCNPGLSPHRLTYINARTKEVLSGQQF